MAKTTAVKKKAAPTAEHLAALEVGRREGRAVKTYMDALEQHRPKRGRKRTAETVKNQIVGVESDLVEAAGLERLLLLQRREDLASELAALESKTDIEPLEDAFVEVAASYGSRKGISYGVWREAGVPPSVLRRAGISRGA